MRALLFLPLALVACGGSAFTAGDPLPYLDGGGDGGWSARSNEPDAPGLGREVAAPPLPEASPDPDAGDPLPDASPGPEGGPEPSPEASPPADAGAPEAPYCAGCWGPGGACLPGSDVHACGSRGVDCVSCPGTDAECYGGPGAWSCL